MVNYEEFKENFKEDVRRELAKKGIEDVEITIQSNEKAQSELRCINR